VNLRVSQNVLANKARLCDVRIYLKDLKKTVDGGRDEVMRVVAEIQRLAERERQTTSAATDAADHPARLQLVKKLRRAASDSQIRYSRVGIQLKYSTLSIFTV